MSEYTGCVHLVSIFNHLEDAEMAKIYEKIQSHSYKKGEYIYQAGDPKSSIYVVHEGQVRIFMLNEAGNEQLIRLVNVGDFFGEISGFSDTEYFQDYAQASSDSKICSIAIDDMMQILEDYPSISMKVLLNISDQLENSVQQTALLAEHHTEKRLARYLVNSMKNNHLDEGQIFQMEISRKDLASYLGTTPETISRKFKALENKDLIKQVSNNQIKILDINGLIFLD